MPKGNKNPVHKLTKAGPGRPKGSKDKFPSALKAKVLFAAAQLEAEGKSLNDEAIKDPKWFWENFVKPMLPKEIGIDLGGSITVNLQMVSGAGDE